ncbi:MAG TPA: alpha/beta fold hydrolase [Candidatus Paceibacterota bacterium]|nr:alpha/beta fold hydrolase [Candidatus Paceibacterota bacterium]HPT17816.1 alpha/beta fold hydrolase [Candidatus Paceibacterota bacterium]
MKKVFIIHGFEGSPNGGWRSWLMEELSKHNIYACALSMPKPDEPILSEWLEEIDRHVKINLNDDIYLIGHSLGSTTILRYIEKNNCENIKGIILVSGPCNINDNKKIDEFLKEKFNWSLIKNKISQVIVIHGDNNPFVPVSDAQEIAKKLNGELMLISNGQHLNGSAGFTELPQLLSALLKII